VRVLVKRKERKESLVHLVTNMLAIKKGNDCVQYTRLEMNEKLDSESSHRC
jgi:hypothetical protein